MALAGAAFLVGAAVAMADPAPPPPPPDTGGGGGATSSSTPATSSDNTPPKRASHLLVSTPKPGRNVLSWTLPPAPDIAAVIVARGPAGKCPSQPLHGAQIGGTDRRTTQIDKTEHDTTRYCYAVFTLDAAGNWDTPVTGSARNPGDTTPPGPVTAVTAVVGKAGAIDLAWTNPAGATHIVVVRGRSSACPLSPTDGARVGTRQLRSSQVDTAVQSAPGTYCYAVFAYDAARNHSDIATVKVTHQAAVSPTTQGSGSAPSSGGSSSSLSDIVAIIGGGAIVLAGLAFITLRLVRREWEWHSRTGYGIRDLMSIDVRDYNRQALVIPAIIGVCIAGALVVLLMSL